MNKYMQYAMRAVSITGILMTSLPAIMADGKISVDEMAGLIKDICGACGWKLSVEVPDSIKGTVLGASVE